MTTDNAGVSLIRNFEGTLLHYYVDTSGYPTIGIGHKIRPSDPYVKGTIISMDEANQLLKYDLRSTESAINADVNVPLSQNQFDALVSLVFNIGDHGFATSHLLRAINASALISVIKPLWLEWNHAGGEVSGDLTRRRAKEFNLYCL